jgi:hypothetical protein
MGAIQSINYPKDSPQKISANSLPEITAQESRSRDSRGSEVMLVNKSDIKVVEKHFKNQMELLSSYLNMYLLFDGYDNKNNVVIKDLEKKLNNQKKELKELYESRDKLRSNIDYAHLKLNESDDKKKILTILIIIFCISLPIILIFIINELRHYTVIN